MQVPRTTIIILTDSSNCILEFKYEILLQEEMEETPARLHDQRDGWPEEKSSKEEQKNAEKKRKEKNINGERRKGDQGTGGERQ
jgi:hypothetical protein